MSKMAAGSSNYLRSPIFTKPSSMLGFLFCKMPYPVATKRMRCVSEVLVVGGRAFSERSCNKKGRLSDLLLFLLVHMTQDYHQ